MVAICLSHFGDRIRGLFCYYLSTFGDAIAEKTGMGRTWVGVVVRASVTSLPELISGASSVVIFDLPNIAIGDVFGSCVFNILIIAVLDVLTGPTPISPKAHQGQVLTVGFGVLLLGIAGIAISAGARLPALGWVGIYSVAFFANYVIAMRMVFLYEIKRILELVHERVEAARYKKITLKKTLIYRRARSRIFTERDAELRCLISLRGNQLFQEVYDQFGLTPRQYLQWVTNSIPHGRSMLRRCLLCNEVFASLESSDRHCQSCRRDRRRLLNEERRSSFA